MELLDRVVGTAKASAERIAVALKLPRARSREPEPFAAVEDGTPSADTLLEPNVARSRSRGGKAGAPRDKIDPRAVLEALAKNTSLLVALSAALVFLLVLAVTAIVVNIPAKAPKSSPGATVEGVAVARRLFPPERSTFRPRMPMEREAPGTYTVEDAVAAGIDWDSIDLPSIRARNDAAIDALLGTVR